MPNRSVLSCPSLGDGVLVVFRLDGNTFKVTLNTVKTNSNNLIRSYIVLFQFIFITKNSQIHRNIVLSNLLNTLALTFKWPSVFVHFSIS